MPKLNILTHRSLVLQFTADSILRTNDSTHSKSTFLLPGNDSYYKVEKVNLADILHILILAQTNGFIKTYSGFIKGIRNMLGVELKCIHYPTANDNHYRFICRFDPNRCFIIKSDTRMDLMTIDGYLAYLRQPKAKSYATSYISLLAIPAEIYNA